MATQDAPKSHKNAKERRERRKQSDAAAVSDPAVARTRRAVIKDGASVVAAPKRSYVDQIRSYIKGVVSESKRVSWPGKPEVIAGTVSTLIILLAFSAFLGMLDSGLGVLTSKLGL